MTGCFAELVAIISNLIYNSQNFTESYYDTTAITGDHMGVWFISC